MNDNKNFWNALNLLNIYSIYLAQENLYENRQQSAQNDVNAANDKQAEYLLTEINGKFDALRRRLDEQDVALRRILEAVEKR